MTASVDFERLRRMLRNEADMAARRRVEIVLEYLAIEPGERLLDCGCGLGWVLKVIDELTDGSASGIDNDLPRLRRAQTELGARVPLAAGSITALPYRDEAFDKIVLSEVLEHVPDDRAAMLEVRRVLKPGGLLAITVPNQNYPLLWDPINWVRERLGWKPIREGFFGGIWTNHVRLYRREDILDLVRSAGLIVEDVRQLVHYCFPFAHNLVYGLGMRLVESGWLAEADRFRYDRNRGSSLNPLNLGRAIFSRIDRWNDPVSDEGKTTVCFGIKARKSE